MSTNHKAESEALRSLRIPFTTLRLKINLIQYHGN